MKKHDTYSGGEPTGEHASSGGSADSLDISTQGHWAQVDPFTPAERAEYEERLKNIILEDEMTQYHSPSRALGGTAIKRLRMRPRQTIVGPRSSRDRYGHDQQPE